MIKTSLKAKEVLQALFSGILSGFILMIFFAGTGYLFFNTGGAALFGRAAPLLGGAAAFIYSGVRMFVDDGAIGKAGIFNFHFGKKQITLDDYLQTKQNGKERYHCLKKAQVGLLMMPGMIIASLAADWIIDFFSLPLVL